jgi:hypothetical protein
VLTGIASPHRRIAASRRAASPHRRITARRIAASPHHGAPHRRIVAVIASPPHHRITHPASRHHAQPHRRIAASPHHARRIIAMSRCAVTHVGRPDPIGGVAKASFLPCRVR